MIEGDHVAIYSLLALAIICAAIVFWSVGAL
jgi:hypothetical protein